MKLLYTSGLENKIHQNIPDAVKSPVRADDLFEPISWMTERIDSWIFKQTPTSKVSLKCCITQSDPSIKQNTKHSSQD